MHSVQLLGVHDRGWQQYLARADHDLFHTAEYHDLSQLNGGGQAWLAVYGSAEKFLCWPYLLRPIPEEFIRTFGGGLYDVTSVYGYPGPVAYNCIDDEEFLSCAWATLVDTWRSQTVISVFTRFHPILENHKCVSSRCTPSNSPGVEGGIYQEGSTVAIDLRISGTETWKAYKKKLRQAVRKCQGSGMTTDSDPEWTNLKDFVRLYYRTMERNHAGEFYFFSVEYFKQLQTILGSRGTLIVARYADAVVGAALLIEYAGIVNVYLLASDENCGHLSPSKLIIHEAQAWARARGNRFLHLGGGRGGREGDTLFRFKASFSNVFYPFYTGRWILNNEAYDVLRIEHQKQTMKLSVKVSETHFPVYRSHLT